MRLDINTSTTPMPPPLDGDKKWDRPARRTLPAYIIHIPSKPSLSFRFPTLLATFSPPTNTGAPWAHHSNASPCARPYLTHKRTPRVLSYTSNFLTNQRRPPSHKYLYLSHTQPLRVLSQDLLHFSYHGSSSKLPLMNVFWYFCFRVPRRTHFYG